MSQLTKLTKQGRARRKRQQLQSMIHAVSSVIQPGDTVCDFGSGQGHLGLLIAYLFPSTRVILIDHNSEKINMAKFRIDQIESGICDMKHSRKRKVCSFKDRIELCYSIGDIEYRPIDLGVGLHCCGNFTDMILAHCKSVKANFCISPCCYGQIKCNRIMKHYNAWQSVIRGADFSVGNANSFDPDNDANFDKCKRCMNFVDAVLRSKSLLGEKLDDYSIKLTSLLPLSCSPKNNVIIGALNGKLNPDKFIDQDQKLSYMFPNVKSFETKKNAILESLLDKAIITSSFLSSSENITFVKTLTPFYRLRCRFGIEKKGKVSGKGAPNMSTIGLTQSETTSQMHVNDLLSGAIDIPSNATFSKKTNSFRRRIAVKQVRKFRELVV